MPDDESDKTRPPVTALRHASPCDLFAAMPGLRDLTQIRPRDDENHAGFMRRLAQTTTPEEAITFTAFAARPKMAVWFGYECLRRLPVDLGQNDRALLELIAEWTHQPETDLRYRIMAQALFAETRSPAVTLGLAVGWSGNQIAPNDPAPVPPQRCPRAVNAAVLSALARTDLSRRIEHLGKCIDLAESLLQAY